MYTNSKIKTSTINGIRTIKTIFYWEAIWKAAKKRALSHCLLRIYIDTKANRVAIIASEVESNKANIGIGRDFEGFASCVIKEFGDLLNIPLSQIIWIQHYGRFSETDCYENSGMRERFSSYQLSLIEAEFKGEQTVLSSRKVQELIAWTNLEPVEQILQEF